MSSYQPTYQHAGAGSPGQTPTAGNPLPSGAAGHSGQQQPPSFRTNVNRNKTKRWVNAKSYAYDGDDWGDSEDGETDEDTPDVPPVPRNNPPHQQPLSTDSTSPSTQDPHASQPPSTGTGAPFIRPADIYKRMAEQQQSSGDARVSDNTPQNQPEPQQPTTSEKQTPSVELPQLKNMSSDFGDDFMGAQTTQHGASSAPKTTGLEKGLDSNTSGGDLQHNPSLGFRSAVNQAFDEADTPDSIVRSNSDTTSTISPIIRSGTASNTQDSRPAITDATPTIEEEPRAESVAPEFKPGYRRSLTPPSSGNNPAQRPVVAASSQPASSDTAQIFEVPRPADEQAKSDQPSLSSSVASPKPDLTVVTKSDGVSSAQPSRPTSFVGRDGPDDKGPRVSGSSKPSSPQSTSAQHPHAAPEPPPKDNVNKTPDRSVSEQPSVPPVAVEHGSSEASETASPNSVNDRLRDAIMQSLNPSPSDEKTGTAYETKSGAHHDEYDSSWNEQGTNTSTAPAPLSSRVLAVAEDEPMPDRDPSESRPAASGAAHPENAHGEPQPQDRPRLKNKFSWEDDESGDDSQSKPTYGNPDERMPSTSAAPQGAPQLDQTHDVNAPRHSGLDTGPTAPEGAHTSSPQRDMPAAGPTDVDQRGETTDEPHGTSSSASFLPGQAMKVAGFREILAIKAHDQKLAAFDHTRDQFATTDTGLDAWIGHIADSSPEHSDTVSLNGQVAADANLTHKAMTSRNKFPKLSSLGALSLPSSHQDNTAGKSGHARQGSGTPLSNMMHGQQVQGKGKDFLHSAGALGGKAGGAAKGLFAKGRSKFRNSGSGDKVPSQPPPPGRAQTDSYGSAAAPPVEPTAPQQGHFSHHERALPALPAVPHSDVSPDTRHSQLMANTAIEPATDWGQSARHTLGLSSPTGVSNQAQDSIEREGAGRGGFPPPDQLRPFAAEQNRPGSPVSTIGVVSDVARPAAGEDPDEKRSSWVLLTRDSVSTLGQTKDAPNPEPQTSSHNPRVSAGDASSMTQAPGTAPVRAGSVQQGDTTDSSRLGYSNPKPATPTTVVQMQGTSAPVHPNSTKGAENPSSDDTRRSSFEVVSDGPSSSPGNIPPDASTGAAQYTGKPPARPFPTIEASEYRKLLEKTISDRAASQNGAQDYVDPNHVTSPRAKDSRGQENEVQSSVPNPDTRVASPGHVENNVTERSYSAQYNSAPAVNSPHSHAQSHPSGILQHQEFSAAQPPPQPQQQQVSETHYPDFQPRPASRVQSGSGFVGLVSKIQNNRQKSTPEQSSPLAEKKKGSRFQSLIPDTRKPFGTQGMGRDTSPHAGSRESKEPESGSFTTGDSKKAIVQKFLRRSSQEQSGDGKRNSRQKFNTLLGRSSPQPAEEAKDPGLPTPNELRKPLPTVPDDSHHAQQTPQTSQRPSHTSRPSRTRYYQPANVGQRATENGNSAITSTKVHPAEERPGINGHNHSVIQQPQNRSYSPGVGLPTDPDVRPAPIPQPNSTNSQSQSPLARDRQGSRDAPNPRAYTADLHIRSRSPLEESPDAQEPESPVKEESGPAANLGTFYAASPEVRRVGDQETPWNLTLPKDGEQSTDKTKQTNSVTSPDSAHQYPLPESTVLSPVDPAAANLPPPPPPKIPLKQTTSGEASGEVSRAKSLDPGTVATATVPKNTSADRQPQVHLTIPTVTIQTDEGEEATSGGESPHPATVNAVPNNTPVDPRPTQQIPPQSVPTIDHPASASPPAETSKGDLSAGETTTTAVPHNTPVEPRPPQQIHESGPMEPVELPAKVTDDDSSEEIVMSSTSYPGQEWQPSYVGDWD